MASHNPRGQQESRGNKFAEICSFIDRAETGTRERSGEERKRTDDLTKEIDCLNTRLTGAQKLVVLDRLEEHSSPLGESQKMSRSLEEYLSPLNMTVVGEWEGNEND